jgi:hypothetical protein
MADNDRLPPKARAKIFTLADQEAAIQTAMHSNLRHINELGKAYDIATDPQAKIELKQETDRRQQVQETQRERHKHLADINGKVRRFLDLLPADASVEDAKPVKIKLKPGETHQQAVATLRLNIVKLLSERSQVERAALPVDEIKAQAKKWIVKRSLEGRPSIVATHEKFDVRFTTVDPEAFTAALDPLALLAWYDPDYLEGKLNDLIDLMPKPKFALTPAAKAERLASIKQDLADAERLECALIEAAQDIGIILDYRAQTDVRCLLGISVSRKKANAA